MKVKPPKPPTEMVPLRGAPLRFGLTVRLTTPSPTPWLFGVRLIQFALLAGDHPQVFGKLETEKLPAPPSAPKDWLAGVIR